MTHREMLEFAAKAAGYDYCPDGYDSNMPYPCIVVDGFPEPWNPKDDDGDSRKLEVALEMNVFQACGVAYAEDAEGDITIREVHGHDPYAATRLAVLRVAAQIGKGMVG